ncbi:MAG: tetratricopeptide repeat protein [bacterium]|nr:tetratricopeptide repeat protein [bacterium]
MKPVRRQLVPASLLISLLCLSISPAAATLPALTVDATADARWAQKAEKLLSKYEHEDAIRLLEEANAAAGGDDPAALRLLVRAHLELGQFPEAIEIAHSWAESTEDPTVRAEALTHLGVALFQSTLEKSFKTRRSHARLMNTKAVRETPQLTRDAVLLRIHGDDLLSEFAILDMATEVLREAIELAPERSPLTHYHLAEALARQFFMEEARARLDEYFALVGDADVPRGPRELRCLLAVPKAPEGQPVTRPTVIKQARQPPPKKAWLRGVRGTVYLQAVIDAHGNVTCVRPLRGLPLGLTEAAVKTLEKSTFEPGRVAGKAAPFRYQVALGF